MVDSPGWLALVIVGSACIYFAYSVLKNYLLEHRIKSSFSRIVGVSATHVIVSLALMFLVWVSVDKIISNFLPVLAYPNLSYPASSNVSLLFLLLGIVLAFIPSLFLIVYVFRISLKDAFWPWLTLSVPLPFLFATSYLMVWFVLGGKL